MGFFSWRHWLRRMAGSPRRSLPSRPRTRSPRLQLEHLETRLAPATDIWSGGPTGNANFNWDHAANWSNGIPNPGDDLVFPSGVAAASLTNTDNLAAGTVFNSISISGSGYTLKGSTPTQSITLGNASGGNPLIVNSSATGDVIQFDIQLGGTAGIFQFFTVNVGSDLTLSGHLSGAAGVDLSKEGTGSLILSSDNTVVNGGFAGPITVDQGILQITNAKALGSVASTTTVQQNAQLQVNNVTGAIAENLIVNGPGVKNDGALLNVNGNNTWAGTIQLDNDTTFGSSAQALNITGQISDNAAGHNLTKEGPGQVIFSHVGGDTYRGLTTVNNGILTIRDPLSLGAAGTVANGTLVNSTPGESGTLQIEDPTGVGFTVLNEQLTLNGPGFTPSGAAAVALGALDNLNGNNTWTTAGAGIVPEVILGSPPPNGSNVSIGVDGVPNTHTDLVIGGVVGDPNGTVNLTKVGTGKLIFTNSNTYRGLTTVSVGILNIRDSQGLGPAGVGGGTTVLNNAALELDVDSRPDSVTGTTNTLQIEESLLLFGRGVNNGGALRNVSGINIWTNLGPSVINLGFNIVDDAIGVDPDPNAHADNSYFTNDYSLTVNTVIEDAPGFNPAQGTGDFQANLSKVGTGQLILTHANTYLGVTFIEQGWVTIQNDKALGGRILPGTLGAGSPGIADTQQPGTIVSAGAALHLKTLTAASPPLNLIENLVLAGDGITHPFSLISGKGALMSLSGNNTVGGLITGDSSTVQLNGIAGIGVELLGPNPVSELSITGSMTDYTPTTRIAKNANGGQAEDARTIDTGSTSGTIFITFDSFTIPDELRVYYPPRGQPGSTRIYDSGLIGTMGPLPIIKTYGPGASTLVEIVVNEGGNANPGTAWTYTATVVGAVHPGGVNKWGSQRLNIQGDGTYTLADDIKQGVLRAQNDTAFGNAVAGTTLETGAAIEMKGGIASDNGGVAAGIQVYGEHLTVSGNGNAGFAQVQTLTLSGASTGTYTLTYQGQQASLAYGATGAQIQAALNALGNINSAVTVTPAGSGTVFTITFGGTLAGVNPSLLVAAGAGGTNATVTGLDAALTSLSDDNMWRGPITLQTGTTVDVEPDARLSLFGTIDDAPNLSPSGSGITLVGTNTATVPDTGKLALIGSNTYRGTTNVVSGILNLQNSQALGASAISEIQTVALSGLASGTFTLTFNGQQTNPALPLPFNATGAQVAAALNLLTSVTSLGGSVSAVRAGNLITITFQGSFAGFDQTPLLATPTPGTNAVVGTLQNGAGGTVVANGASLELQGNITIAGEPLMIAGAGVNGTSAVSPRWFEQGPAPIANGQTPGNQNVTGRVTGVAVDPSDPNVIYLAAAGGGAWKTKDGGQTWQPLFDLQLTPGAQNSQIFSGAIAVDPNDPRIIYLGTGEADNSGDSFYGTGVYKSTDSGKTWALLGGVGNPLSRKGISKIVVDPNTANAGFIYVADSDLTVNGTGGTGTQNSSTAANPGVWRWDGTTWFNLTNLTSTTRANTLGQAPYTAPREVLAP